jgi:hypothetical protein
MKQKTVPGVAYSDHFFLLLIGRYPLGNSDFGEVMYLSAAESFETEWSYIV